jgi:hypothetical protein
VELNTTITTGKKQKTHTITASDGGATTTTTRQKKTRITTTNVEGANRSTSSTITTMTAAAPINIPTGMNTSTTDTVKLTAIEYYYYHLTR